MQHDPMRNVNELEMIRKALNSKKLNERTRRFLKLRKKVLKKHMIIPQFMKNAANNSAELNEMAGIKRGGSRRVTRHKRSGTRRGTRRN